MKFAAAKLSAILLLICLYIISIAQTGLVKRWDYTYGGKSEDFLTSIIQTTDGGFMLGGYTKSGVNGDVPNPVRGQRDYWIVKIDANGQKLWTKRYGGDKDDYMYSLLQTSDNGYLLGGFSYSNAGGDKSQPNRSPLGGGDDYWVVKTDAQGNLQWEKTFGGADSDVSYSLLCASDGGYLIGGFSDSRNDGDKTEDNWDTTSFYSDYWIVKIDAQGIKQWDKRYGGKVQDGLSDMCSTIDGGYMLGGISYSSNTGNKGVEAFGNGDYWLVKIDSAGNKQWEKGLGGIAMEQSCYVVQLRDGSYIEAGGSLSQPSGNKSAINYGGTDYWLVKLDNEGNILWDKSYGGGVMEYVSTITQTLDNGLLICGSSTTPFPNGTKTEANLGEMQTWLVKTDSAGNKQWDKTILTTGYSYGNALQSSDGCYVIGAATGSGMGGDKSQPNISISNDNYDYWVVKFCEQPVGVNDITDKVQLQVYPNPTEGDISISIQQTNLHAASFTITNAIGQVLYYQQETNLADSYTKMLDLRNLPGGSYFVTIETNGERIVKQVMKQ